MVVIKFRTGLEKRVAVVLGLLFFVTGLYFVSDAPLKFFITEVRPVVFLSLAALVVSARKPINRLFKNKGNDWILVALFFLSFFAAYFYMAYSDYERKDMFLWREIEFRINRNCSIIAICRYVNYRLWQPLFVLCLHYFWQKAFRF